MYRAERLQRLLREEELRRDALKSDLENFPLEVEFGEADKRSRVQPDINDTIIKWRRAHEDLFVEVLTILTRGKAIIDTDLDIHTRLTLSEWGITSMTELLLQNFQEIPPNLVAEVVRFLQREDYLPESVSRSDLRDLGLLSLNEAGQILKGRG